MSKHYQLLDFLRCAPKALLQAYCSRHGILQDFDWGRGKKVDADAVAAALKSLPPGEFDQITADFRGMWDLAGVGFTRGVLSEAKFHDDKAASERLEKHSHLGKVLWTMLERPQYLPNAKILSEVDKLPPGAWIKRGGLPARAGPVDQAVVEALQDALIDFFSKTQHRGRHCKIDCLRQGDEEIFYTYAEDHPDTDLFWQDGQLESRVLSPPFNLMFRHNDRQRTLSIYIEGDRDVVPDLQQIFARTVIGDEIPREAPDAGELYNLDRLLEPGFRFEYAADLGIADVRVTKMRFRVDGEPWRRFTAEADNFKHREALQDFVASLTARLPKSRLVLDQACVNVVFHRRAGDRRPPSRTFYITRPSSLRLKRDELGDKICAMLLQSDIEQRVTDER